MHMVLQIGHPSKDVGHDSTKCVLCVQTDELMRPEGEIHPKSNGNKIYTVVLCHILIVQRGNILSIYSVVIQYMGKQLFTT